MRWLDERVVTALAALFTVFAIVQPDPSTAVLLGVAACAVGLALAAAHSATLNRATVIPVGQPARQRREAPRAEPAPLHPDTAGRPRTRAPSQSLMVA